MKLSELLQAADTRDWQIPDSDPDLIRAVIDSRDCSEGTIFCPLKGEHADGHDFIPAAFDKGASASFTAKSVYVQHPEWHHFPLIVVPDPLTALQTLAIAKKKRVSPRIIAITGSVGKTTTRRMLAHILESDFTVSQSEKNFNNAIGLPISLFNIRENAQIAVLEMGANHPGEIADLCRIAPPDLALITCIAPAHIEGFGSIEAIRKAKFEIFNNAHPDATLFINADDEHISQYQPSARMKALTYSLSGSADYSFTTETKNGELSLSIEGRELMLPGSSPALARNAAAAYSVCHSLGMSHESIAEKILNFPTPVGRGNIIHLAGAMLINDAYNASPVSLANAVATLQNMNCAGRKKVVFGDMLELGSASDEAHRVAGRLLAGAGFSELICCGPNAELTAREAQVAGMSSLHYFREKKGIADLIAADLQPGDCILFKASRGLALETIIEELKTKL